jgi:hypothetical protein
LLGLREALLDQLRQGCIRGLLEGVVALRLELDRELLEGRDLAL